jgi:hypothetical protein
VVCVGPNELHKHGIAEEIEGKWHASKLVSVVAAPDGIARGWGVRGIS